MTELDPASQLSWQDAGVPRRGRHRMCAIGALGSALLMFLGTPPFNLWPLGLVALVPLWLTIRDLSARPAFGWGWACGLAIHLVGQSWSMSVVQRFAGVGAPTAIGIWFVICAYQALVFALWAGGTRWLAGRRGIPTLVAAPLTIAIVETVVPFLFPWHLG